MGEKLKALELEKEREGQKKLKLEEEEKLRALELAELTKENEKQRLKVLKLAELERDKENQRRKALETAEYARLNVPKDVKDAVQLVSRYFDPEFENNSTAPEYVWKAIQDLKTYLN